MGNDRCICGPATIDGYTLRRSACAAHEAVSAARETPAPPPPDDHGLLARLAEYERCWLWHEADDENTAGYGHHMEQMLYHLPMDGQTRDIKASIEAMLTDLRTLALGRP